MHSGEDDDKVMATCGDNRTAAARAISLRGENRNPRSSRKGGEMTGDTNEQSKEGREARDGLRSHRNKHEEERSTDPASKEPSNPGRRNSSRRTSSRKNDDVSCSSCSSRSESVKIISSHRSRDVDPREHRWRANDYRSVSSSHRGVTAGRDRLRRSVRDGGETTLKRLDDLTDENIDVYGGFSNSGDERKGGGYLPEFIRPTASWDLLARAVSTITRRTAVIFRRQRDIINSFIAYGSNAILVGRTSGVKEVTPHT